MVDCTANGVVGCRPQVVFCAPEGKKKGSAIPAQLGNAALTAGGVVGTGVLTSLGAKAFKIDSAKPLCTINGKVVKLKNGIIGNKVVNFFNKLGDKMFKSEKINELIAEAGGGKNAKGQLALATLATVATVGLIAKGIYNAGKISGEHKE